MTFSTTPPLTYRKKIAAALLALLGAALILLGSAWSESKADQAQRANLAHRSAQ